MSDERAGDRDFTERATEATEESRRAAGEEDRAIEDQADSLTVDDDEDEGEVSAY